MCGCTRECVAGGVLRGVRGSDLIGIVSDRLIPIVYGGLCGWQSQLVDFSYFGYFAIASLRLVPVH